LVVGRRPGREERFSGCGPGVNFRAVGPPLVVSDGFWGPGR